LLEEYSAERVAKVLAQPEPYGLNFKTSDSSLNRFRERVRAAEKKRHSEAGEKEIGELLAKAHESEEAFQTIAKRLIKTRLLNATKSSLSSAETIDSLIT